MFTGAYRNRVDEKGRLAIPAGFRAKLGQGSHISIGPDNLLVIYPADQWEAMVRQLNTPFPSREQRELSRALFATAVECAFDNQGRVTLSPEQRRLLQIDLPATVSVVGTGSRIEIWPETTWAPYSDGARGRFTELVDAVIQRP